MRVSVVMPVYNAERFLDQALASVLGQSFTDFELILINDGSTDGTGRIAAAAAAADPRIILVSRENRGLTLSLNEGLALAKGEFVARMDGDDIATPDRFARQVAFLDAHPDHVLVGGQMQLIDPDGRYLKRLPLPLDHDGIVAMMLVENTAGLGHPTVMFRRDPALAIGGYRREYDFAEDMDFFLRLAEIGKLANLPDQVLLYRLHSKSVSHLNMQAQTDASFRAARDAARRMGRPPPPPAVMSGEETATTIFRRWAWWALQDREIGTARHYALRALTSEPLSIESWRLAYCALRGR